MSRIARATPIAGFAAAALLVTAAAAEPPPEPAKPAAPVPAQRAPAKAAVPELPDADVRARYGWDAPKGAKKLDPPYAVEGTEFPLVVAPQKQLGAPAMVLSYMPPDLDEPAPPPEEPKADKDKAEEDAPPDDKPAKPEP